MSRVSLRGEFDLGSYHPPSDARTGTTTKSPYDDDSHTGTTEGMSHSRTSASPTSRSPMSGRRHSGYQQRTSGQIPQALTWRLDPDESLSDWTIIVLSSEGVEQSKGTSDASDNSDNDSIADDSYASEANIKYYYVHKTQLGVGPRRSEYFARLFRSHRQNHDTGDETVSRIELKPSAASAFPDMLDFLYSPPGTPVNATTENAVALRHLATCFGIRELFTEVTGFIQRDLNVSTALTYLNEAATYSHEKLLMAAIKLCALNFASIKLSRLVQLPPALFERIVCSTHFKCDSETYSSRVASYCRCRPASIDPALLRSLTDAEKMPLVSKDEALFLISVLIRLGMAPDIGRDGGDEHDRSFTVDHASLYERCAEAATESVRYAVQNSGRSPTPVPPREKRTEFRRKEVDAEYNMLPPAVKIDLLEKAMISSQSTTDSDFQSREEIPVSPTSPARSPTNGVRLKYNKEDFQRLKKSYEKKLAAYHSKLSKREDEIRRYAEEIGKFRRVPNGYRNSPLLAEYTYKEQPQYDGYGDNMYGTEPPTALPRSGRPEKDGWIYREERWHDNRRDIRYWPMFYYKAN